MTSFYGYYQTWDTSNLNEKPRQRETFYPRSYTPGTIMHYIASNPQFSLFSYIVKLADMDCLFNDPQFKYTVFVPINTFCDEKMILSLDKHNAKKIVLYSTIDNLVYENTLRSNCLMLDTRLKTDRLAISNFVLNNVSKIIESNIIRSNGLIHVVNNLLVPTII
jgi:uncharacterized surface protein with fasciclin (FAS1) repeats